MSWIVWLTGPPASGKTAIASALSRKLSASGVAAIRLESDALRRVLTPQADYSPSGRGRFYAMVADLAALLAEQGFNVLVDATAPRRAHRQRLRDRFPGLVEVHVDAPLAVREARDPKGLYRRARSGNAPHLPGVSEPYEPPLAPDLALSGTETAAGNARRLLRLLAARGLMPTPK
jgi:adenylyl-sulfate kinase